MGDGNDKSKEVGGNSSASHTASPNADPGMNFESADSISELVWSPRHGLSIRCTDFSLTRNPKLHSPTFFDLGQFMSQEEAGSPVKYQLSTRDHVMVDKTEADVNQGCSRKSNEMNIPLSGIGGSVEDLKHEREKIIEETRAGTSRRSLGSPTAIGGKDKTLLGSAGSQELINHGDKEGEEEKTITKVLDGDHVESTDENDLTSRAVAASSALEACDESKGKCLPEVEKAGPSAKAKEKEKASSDGNLDGRANEDKDAESFGSVESCNSAGLLSRGKKRSSFENQLMLRSKRIKTLSQEGSGSASKLKHDSSFMIWISNMRKGSWRANDEANSPGVALTTTLDANAIADEQDLSPCKNTGFQSFFQSMYCPRKRGQDAAEMDFSNDPKPASLQKFPRLPEKCLITNGDHHLSSSDKEIGLVAETSMTSGKAGFNQAKETFSPESKHEDKEPKARGEAGEKITQCLANRNSGVENLWISRFSAKSSFPQIKDPLKGTATKVNDSTSDVAKPRDLQKFTGRFDNLKTLPSIVSSPRIKSSEAMVSTFARRLGAIKQFMPSGPVTENLEKGQTGIICSYCGKKGHPLRDCLEVTDTELRDLVQNISSLNGREEASSLCIRCFQPSHWAATCPNAPQHNPGVEDRAMKHAVPSTAEPKLPLSNFTDAPKAVFDAVEQLRLTRTDIRKWMNTKKSDPGLEGFFLRLRFGNGEEGSEGTGYHVARIDGAIEGQSSRKHTENSSISVNVGGMTYFVESQFISNHNFLEEELKAWWRSQGRSGGEGIPLEEELSRKIQQRKMLGL